MEQVIKLKLDFDNREFTTQYQEAAAISHSSIDSAKAHVLDLIRGVGCITLEDTVINAQQVITTSRKIETSY